MLFYNIFSNAIFYPCILQYFQVSKSIPALACLVALMIWHSCMLLCSDLWNLRSEIILVQEYLYICNPVKLPFFQKVEAVVIVIDLIHNIIVFDAQANPTCHFALQCANREAYFVILQYNTRVHSSCAQTIDIAYCISNLLSIVKPSVVKVDSIWEATCLKISPLKPINVEPITIAWGSAAQAFLSSSSKMSADTAGGWYANGTKTTLERYLKKKVCLFVRYQYFSGRWLSHLLSAFCSSSTTNSFAVMIGEHCATNCSRCVPISAPPKEFINIGFRILSLLGSS